MSVFPAVPFGAVDRIEIGPVPLAVIRHQGVGIADLREIFDAGYTALGALISTGDIAPTGPALAVYRGDPMHVFDLELGFPIAGVLDGPREAPGGLRVMPSLLPEGAAAATTVIGGYEGLGAAWAGFVERALGEGLQPRGFSIEVYVGDPRTTPSEDLRTDLLLPVS